MNYDWYQVFNLNEFIATGLVQRSYALLFPSGLKTILVTRGFYYSVVIDDVFLTVGLNDRNPFSFDSRSVFLDSDNNVWVGILNEN